MKKISLIIIIAAFFGLAGQKLNAQELKFGHINTAELIQALPDYDTAVARLERYGRDLSNQLELMQVELNNKSLAYEREAANLADVVRQTREQELYDLNTRITQSREIFSQQFQERQAEYFQPIMEKINRAIQEVGRENGFIYIFIVGQGQETSVVYFDDTKSTDIMPLVKTKLGIR